MAAAGPTGRKPNAPGSCGSTTTGVESTPPNRYSRVSGGLPSASTVSMSPSLTSIDPSPAPRKKSVEIVSLGKLAPSTMTTR